MLNWGRIKMSFSIIFIILSILFNLYSIDKISRLAEENKILTEKLKGCE